MVWALLFFLAGSITPDVITYPFPDQSTCQQVANGIRADPDFRKDFKGSRVECKLIKDPEGMQT